MYIDPKRGTMERSKKKIVGVYIACGPPCVRFPLKLSGTEEEITLVSVCVCIAEGLEEKLESALPAGERERL